MAEGQLEAFDPPATRKLIVAEGATAWWGVDPGTRRVAVAWVRPREHGAGVDRGVETVMVPDLQAGARLAHIVESCADAAVSLVRRQVWPGVIVVEQPSGKQPNPALSYAVGAAIAGLVDGVDDAAALTRQPVVEMVSSSAWKKTACGFGAIYKPGAGVNKPYGVLTWANANGYRGTSWDEADAWGIAEYARKTYALEERL